ncbi:hypothetical protein [Pedobacter sp. UBA5917]|jgi:hypothetical protein|uniref:hypothetical protein n=1 Tax=Pedobacter sp. UBA5917 TaxID=1947061 RepID=UPI0025DBB6AA|nr:hypothetical protein [Pedobacter sp. UBA5917]
MTKKKLKTIIGLLLLLIMMAINLVIAFKDYRLSSIRLSDFYAYQAFGTWNDPTPEARKIYRTGVEDTVQVSFSYREKKMEAKIYRHSLSIKYIKFPTQKNR